jgi:hypothetical protein
MTKFMERSIGSAKIKEAIRADEIGFSASAVHRARDGRRGGTGGIRRNAERSRWLGDGRVLV